MPESTTYLRSTGAHRFAAAGAVLAAALLVLPGAARSQSCILTRLDSPVLSAFDPAFDPQAEGQKWMISFGYRYGKGGRHFVGTEERKERQRENSEVINEVNLVDLSLRRSFNARSSLEVGIPYLMAVREGPIRNDERELIGRQVRSNTRGIGDITVVFNRLVWDPAAHHRSNLSLGVGVKLPTGENSAHDSMLDYQDGELVRVVETADQSVQPGDGGFGLVLQASGYRLLDADGAIAGYASGSYIIAPEGTSGTLTYRSSPEEAVMSIADQYVARAGGRLSPRSWKGWSAGLGARLEGIPPHDLFGSSDGFRRPGYILSVEPSVAWTRGVHTAQLAVPIAVERNRQRSVPDIRRGRHGDASFPACSISPRRVFSTGPGHGSGPGSGEKARPG